MSLTLREEGDIPIGYENVEAVFNPANGKWEYNFDTTQLEDGYYTLKASATDASGNISFSNTVIFSIRNWAVIELLPASQDYKAGRTMPIKFSLRIAEVVDTYQPFVYNEDLMIKILDSEDNSLQESIFGDKSTDYRIDQEEEIYITNFKTAKLPAKYKIEIWRVRNNFLIGKFNFETVSKDSLSRVYIEGDYICNYVLGELVIIDNFNYGLGDLNEYSNFTSPSFTGLPTYNTLGYGGINFGSLNYGFATFGKPGNLGFSNYDLDFGNFNYRLSGFDVLEV